MVFRGRSAASLRQNCVTVFSFSKNHFSSPSGRWSIVLDRKSGSAGMPRPISYAVFCLKKKYDHVSFLCRSHASWRENQYYLPRDPLRDGHHLPGHLLRDVPLCLRKLLPAFDQYFLFS